VVAAPHGDFLVDGRMTIEVGGRSKSAVQVRDVPHHYLALDGIETGIRRHVPLWLFGLLY
jgi:hypothetical protein